MNPDETALSAMEQLTIERDALSEAFTELQRTHRSTALENARLKSELVWWVEQARKYPRSSWD